MTRLERRTVLGAVGTGALGAAAGCLDFEFLEADDSPQQFEADDLDSILSMDALNVARPAPVRPSEGAVDDAIDRLDELLESVPDPLEADDVSIDAVRREIDGTREIARDKREAVAESSDRFHTMRRSIVARRFARQAAIAFDAVDDGPSGDKLESAFEDVATRVERQKTESEYLGTDPQRTLLLEYRRESELAAAGRWLERLESELDTAGQWLDDRSRDDTTVALSVGEIGGVIERARAALAFTTELERRHEARLDDDRSFETRFEDALDRSLAAIDAADIPGHSSGLVESVDADVSETVAERVLREGALSVVGARARTRDEAAAGRTASALREACAFERDRRAFETIRERIEDGAHRTIETVDDVREVRESALETAADASFAPDDPSLGGDSLAHECERLERVDASIRSVVDASGTDLLDQYAEYVVIGARLEALPEAVAVLEDRLEA